ncbi:MAG: hypothetical protein IPN76_19690 [Saprospiraceae bacterium]|nr:hypothetical protein [Saprospiraceae bacterium]
MLKNFLLIVHCIIRCRTVCLYKCRAEAGAILQRRNLKLESIYKQFIRFFKMKWIDGFCMGIAWLIISMSGLRTEAFLVMDRTNWKLGGIDINVLFIGLLLPNGCFVPIVWKPLARKATAALEERKALMGRFQKAWRPFNSLENQRVGGQGVHRGGVVPLLEGMWVLLRHPAPPPGLPGPRGGLHQENGGQDGRAHPQEAQA